MSTAFFEPLNRLAPGRRRKRGSKEELQLVNRIIRRFSARLFSALSLAERVKYLLKTLSQPASSRKSEPTRFRILDPKVRMEATNAPRAARRFPHVRWAIRLEA